MVMGENGSVSVTSKCVKRTLLEAESVLNTASYDHSPFTAVNPMTLTSRDDNYNNEITIIK